MHNNNILYEPLPIGRIGVRKDTDEVVVASDFSCFAHMLEEYICFGAVEIVMPKSAPEVSTFEQMPSLLRKRIRIVDDDNETEAVRRLLFDLRKEFSVKTNEENQHLNFPKDTPGELVRSIVNVHLDVKKIALGFNKKIQIEIDPQKSIYNFKYLREKSSNGQVRVILAQLESLLRLYGDVSFNAPCPPKEMPPREIITVFDRLINDPNYIEYSESIFKLSSPKKRKQALLKLRELERVVRSKSFYSTGWNHLAKVIKVWTGVPVPESSAIASIIEGSSLPSLVNFQNARFSAIETWKKSNLTEEPIRRDGNPVANGEIVWIPPLESSMDVYPPSDHTFSLGKAGELAESLRKIADYLEGEEEDNKA